MKDEPFEPFEPRRLDRLAVVSSVSQAEDPSADEAETDDSQGDEVRDMAVLPPCDPAACSAAVRAMAVRLASLACARALREAVARNPLFVARFVDDALRATGDSAKAKARLNPGDARLCAGAVRCDIVADAELERGHVIVQTDSGTIEATIDERASILVRAFAAE